MAAIDLEALLGEVSPDAPCGEDLSYDPEYLELDRAAQGTPEQVMGDETIEAVEANWSEVASRSAGLLGRSKDLRVALYLALAALRLEGLPGLRDGLALLRGLLETYWDGLHPQLDPDDDNDPTERVNIIESLAQPEGSFQDPMMFIRRAREAPLTDSKQLGRFSQRDLLIATGEVAAPEGEAAPLSIEQINAAFEDTDTETLQATAQAAAEAAEHVASIDAFLIEKVGADQAAQLDAFKKAIDEVGKPLQEQLARRGYGVPGTEEAPAAEAAEAGPGGAPKALTGEITSPQDVLLALDKICRYYETHEPSSPVPLLLRRAQRLVSKNFVEVIQDLSPQAMQQIDLITGIDSSAQEQ